jgi:hypothetical protein
METGRSFSYRRNYIHYKHGGGDGDECLVRKEGKGNNRNNAMIRIIKK